MPGGLATAGRQCFRNFVAREIHIPLSCAGDTNLLS